MRIAYHLVGDCATFFRYCVRFTIRDSRPYGVAITPDGAVWYSESGVTPNTIVRFDPEAKSFLSWKIPSGGGVVRNMVTTPEGNLYLACSGKNKVAIVHVVKYKK
jgi:virginiamycin B lyase